MADFVMERNLLLTLPGSITNLCVQDNTRVALWVKTDNDINIAPAPNVNWTLDWWLHHGTPATNSIRLNWSVDGPAVCWEWWAFSQFPTNIAVYQWFYRPPSWACK